jgi:ParB-like chromosome segregation protein Spo0J
VAHIAPPLRSLAYPRAKLRPMAANARSHDPTSIATLAAQIKRFAWRGHIIEFDATGEVFDGNGRLAAAAVNGWDYVPAMPSDLSAEQLRAYALSTNRTAELSGWNLDQLVHEIESLRDLGLADVVEELKLGDDVLADLERLTQWSEAPVPDSEVDAPEPSASSRPPTDKLYLIVIDCAGEREQRDRIAQLQDLGLTCRAMVK